MKFLKQLLCEHDYSEETPVTTRTKYWFPYATHDKCSKCGKVNKSNFNPHLELMPKKKYKQVKAWIEVE